MRFLVHIGLLVLLSEAANAAVLLGSNRCTWGPSYWCSHVGTMKECSSAGYCTRLWQRGHSVSSTPDASPEDCGFCRLLASDLAHLARANRTAEESRRLATAACGLVPQPRFRALCQAVVQNYMEEVTQLLMGGLPADRLCSALSLCGGGRRDPRLHVAMETTPPVTKEIPVARVPLGKPVIVANSGAPALLLRGAPMPALPTAADRVRGSFCDACVEIVGTLKLAAGNPLAEAEVAQLLKDTLCTRMSDMQSICGVWVDGYVPELMKRLASMTDPKQICVKADFCPAAAKFRRHPLMQLMKLQKSKVKPLKGVECELCETLVSEARQMLRENKTQEEIIEFVKDRVCNLVPAEKDKCIRAVTEYGPIIFQLLVSELDPNSVCQALGACGKSVAAPRHPRAGPQCLVCEFAMREIDQILGSNRTEAAIQSALETVCSIMPQTVRKECDDFVRQYTPAVLQLLSQDLSPAVICTVLGLCAGPSRPQAPLSARAAALGSATTCDICQTVLLYVKSLLKENATEQEVMNVLEKVCNFLPTQEQPACRTFIEQYTPYIIQLLLQDVNPMEICQTIGLCPKAAKVHGPRRPRYHANGLVQMNRDEAEPIY